MALRALGSLLVVVTAWVTFWAIPTRAETTSVIFVGMTEPVKAELKGGDLPAESRDYYLAELRKVPGVKPSDTITFSSYYATGNVLRVNVPTARAKEIAAAFEKANLPFAKFIELAPAPAKKTAQ